MNKKLIEDICESRLLTGFLGEKQQAAWWDSSFLSPSSSAFLNPIYPNSILMAQYYGVCQAASIVHDEHIGIGRHFHLYCLPESIERTMSKTLHDNDFSINLCNQIATKESAIKRIKELGGEIIDRAEGPIVVGDFSDDKAQNLLKKLLSHYLTAFEFGYKCYPYMRSL